MGQNKLRDETHKDNVDSMAINN